ncbi:MAG TPA: hypothetical protein VH370_11045 [Humisphaera sp.]|nr:hypothetical protein [Humisphaera sp.]
MLRISRIQKGSSITLKLEGKLLEPWVGEFRKVCLESGSGEANLHLDLAAVSFVDAAGTDALADLMAGGASIIACSNFVAELLHWNKP